jgi:hypothetical protein
MGEPEKQKEKYRWKMPAIRLSTLVAVVSLLTAVITVWSTYIKQSDDFKVITGRNGVLIWDPRSNTYSLRPDNVTFINSGNRPVVALGMALTYTKGMAQDVTVDLHYCGNWSKKGKRLDLGIGPIVVNPNAVATVTPQKKDGNTTVPYENEVVDLRPDVTNDREWFLSCLQISFSTPDSSETKLFPIMKLEMTAPPGYAREPVENRWIPAIASANTETGLPKVLIQRTRTTFVWVNDLLHFVARQFRRI